MQPIITVKKNTDVYFAQLLNQMIENIDIHFFSKSCRTNYENHARLLTFRSRVGWYHKS